MTDLRSQLNPSPRRPSSNSSALPDIHPKPIPSTGKVRNWTRSSPRFGKVPSTSPLEEAEELLPGPAIDPSKSISPPRANGQAFRSTNLKPATPNGSVEKVYYRLVVEGASPARRGRNSAVVSHQKHDAAGRLSETDAQVHGAGKLNLAARRQSPISFDHTHLFPSRRSAGSPTRAALRSPLNRLTPQNHKNMPHRKIWIKRPNAVATQVTITEDDLVDDVKDMVLRKYANSLGRNFDPPDVALKVVLGPHSSRHTNDRVLHPDENISKILDHHYPGGQSIDEALLVDVPQRRTPKQSPHVQIPYYVNEDVRPAESGSDYFPPMPVVGPQSPHHQTIVSAATGLSTIPRPPAASHPHSIAVLETGHVPNLPSPGATTRTRHSERPARPRYNRQATTSPGVLAGVPHSHTHGKMLFHSLENVVSKFDFQTPTTPCLHRTRCLLHQSRRITYLNGTQRLHQLELHLLGLPRKPDARRKTLEVKATHLRGY